MIQTTPKKTCDFTVLRERIFKHQGISSPLWIRKPLQQIQEVYKPLKLPQHHFIFSMGALAVMYLYVDAIYAHQLKVSMNKEEGQLI